MTLIQIIINGIVSASVSALIAIAFGLLYRTTKIFNISIASVYLTASFITYLLYKNIPILSIIVGILATCLLGVVIEITIYYPLTVRKASPATLLISSIAVNVVLINLLALLFGNETKLLDLFERNSLKIGDLIISYAQLIQITISFCILTTITILMNRNKYFKLIRALGDNPILLKTHGYSVIKIRILVTLISSFLLATASLLKSFDIGFNLNAGTSAFLAGSVAVFLGGVENPNGWVFSSFIISLIQSIVVYNSSNQWNEMVLFITLILVIMLKPQGMFSFTSRIES